MPAALSTSRTPSGVAVNDIANCFHDPSLDFRQRAAHARTCRELMPAAAEALANRRHIRGFALRAHADAHFAVDAAPRKKRPRSRLRSRAGDRSSLRCPPASAPSARAVAKAETESREPAVRFESHRPEQLAQQLRRGGADSSRKATDSRGRHSRRIFSSSAPISNVRAVVFGY